MQEAQKQYGLLAAAAAASADAALDAQQLQASLQERMRLVALFKQAHAAAAADPNGCLDACQTLLAEVCIAPLSFSRVGFQPFHETRPCPPVRLNTAIDRHWGVPRAARSSLSRQVCGRAVCSGCWGSAGNVGKHSSLVQIRSSRPPLPDRRVMTKRTASQSCSARRSHTVPSVSPQSWVDVPVRSRPGRAWR